jgi:hypothetical protein
MKLTPVTEDVFQIAVAPRLWTTARAYLRACECSLTDGARSCKSPTVGPSGSLAAIRLP